MRFVDWFRAHVLRLRDNMYLSCRELVELVTEYVEGALPPRERERFEEHIMTCAPCRAHLEQMEHTIKVVGCLPLESLSADAERDLLEAFKGWKTEA